MKASRLPEPLRLLFKTLTGGCRELLTFCLTRLTNAGTEAVNLNAKTFKRIGRGYRSHDNYRCHHGLPADTESGMSTQRTTAKVEEPPSLAIHSTNLTTLRCVASRPGCR